MIASTSATCETVDQRQSLSFWSCRSQRRQIGLHSSRCGVRQLLLKQCSRRPLLHVLVRQPTFNSGKFCVNAAPVQEPTSVGEDSAAFDPATQNAQSWIVFFGLLAGVLGLIYAVWIDPTIGAADDVLAALSQLSDSSTTTMVLILTVFAIAHSGLAYLRPYGEDLIGSRAYRVIFALVSLPLAILAVVYFINHRYDGMALWNIRGMPLVHESVWITNFVSFFFLYPSTFNILEVAAVDKPKVHLWETGIIRITRHPQMVGQALWCAAHTAWIGSSFMVVTSAMLMAHHLFSVWHGDFRLRRKYGEAFDDVAARTSVVPFKAILEGRQQLPSDYYKEFLRLPYVTVTILTLGAYWAHPLMQRASYWLGW